MIIFLILLIFIIIITGIYFFIRKREKIEKEIISKINQKISPDISNYYFYEKIILLKNLPEISRVTGIWLLAEFYKENKNVKKKFIRNALSHYATLIQFEHHKQFIEDAYFNIANLFLFDFFDFNKAVDCYKILLEKIKETKWLQVCNERIYIIETGLSDPGSLKNYYTGEKYFSENNLKEAVSEFEKIIAENKSSPLVPSSLYFLGDIYNFKYNDFETAIEKYKMVVEKYQGYRYAPNCQYKIAECLRKMNKWEESVQEFKLLLSRFPDFAYCDYVQYFIGDGFEHLNDFINARRAYNLLLGNYPSSMWIDMAKMKIDMIEKQYPQGKK